MTFILPETCSGFLPYDIAAPVRRGQNLRCQRFDKFIPVTMAEGSHPFPFRTRPLSPPAPMVLPG